MLPSNLQLPQTGFMHVPLRRSSHKLALPGVRRGACRYGAAAPRTSQTAL